MRPGFRIVVMLAIAPAGALSAALLLAACGGQTPALGAPCVRCRIVSVEAPLVPVLATTPLPARDPDTPVDRGSLGMVFDPTTDFDTAVEQAERVIAWIRATIDPVAERALTTALRARAREALRTGRVDQRCRILVLLATWDATSAVREIDRLLRSTYKRDTCSDWEHTLRSLRTAGAAGRRAYAVWMRRQFVAGLRDRRAIGLIEVVSEYQVRYSGGAFGGAGGWAERPIAGLAPIGTSMPLRECDVTAETMRRFFGGPRFELGWPEPARDAAIRARLLWIRGLQREEVGRQPSP